MSTQIQPLPFLSWLSPILIGDFKGDQTQTMWEGYLRYRICQYALDQGYFLEFGVTGGAGTNGCRLQRNAGTTIVSDITFPKRDSANLVVRSPNAGFPALRLQIATYPQTGSKAGRGTFDSFKVGLNYSKNEPPREAAFVFIADFESYKSLSGERRGERGPPITKNVFALPNLKHTISPQYFAIENCHGALYLFSTTVGIRRVLGTIWRPSS